MATNKQEQPEKDADIGPMRTLGEILRRNVLPSTWEAMKVHRGIKPAGREE